MRAQLRRVSNKGLQSFSVRHDRLPTVNNYWHFHAEYELVALRNGSGVLYVGDQSVSFGPGDVFLTGPHQPHYFKFDESCFLKGGESVVDAKVCHFDLGLWGEDFLNLPENTPLRELLEKGRHGFKLARENNGNMICRMMTQVLKSEGAFRLLGLMRILLTMASEKLEYFSSVEIASLDRHKYARWEQVVDYIHSHYKEDIPLHEIAEVAKLSPAGFCRFFKAHTGVTLTQYVMDIRIEKARRLLSKGTQSIKQICFECGFNNFSSFHKSFKAAVGTTPLSFRNHVLSNTLGYPEPS